MREVKPSTTQRAVLELLAQDAAIDPGKPGRFGPSIHWLGNFRPVSRATFDALRWRGWIAKGDTLLGPSTRLAWRITDAGRQALA